MSTGILSSYSGLPPEIKRAVGFGTGVVVDKKGRGDFMTIAEAFDRINTDAASDSFGHAVRVFIRAGTYEEGQLIIKGFNVHVEGESWDTHIEHTQTANEATITMETGAKQILQNVHISHTTTGQTGLMVHQNASHATIDRCWLGYADSVAIRSDGAYNRVQNCLIHHSDADQVQFYGASAKAISNEIHSGAASGVNVNSNADNSMINDNHIYDNGGDPIYVPSSAGNCVVVGNRTDGAINFDGSGGSTAAGNNEVAY